MPKYDKAIVTGAIGTSLYNRWKIIKDQTDDPTFKDYKKFYKWALESGYVAGARLFRRDIDEPFSCYNCFFVIPTQTEGTGKPLLQGAWGVNWIKQWDETVNRIRVHFGMEPIYSPEEYYEQKQ